MKYFILTCVSFFLFGCSKVIQPTETVVTPPQNIPPVIIQVPTVPQLTDKGLTLIVEFEGYDLKPEYPGAGSGITTAIGYDWSTVNPKVSVLDWKALPPPQPQRLAATYSYTGQKAKQHVQDVIDIISPKPIGYNVFQNIDVPRVYSQCQRAFPGFDQLKSYARDALISLVYNRGIGMVGPSRAEMRELPALIKNKDYNGIADCFRRMERVWVGTDIYNGMRSRREAEARLMLTL